MKAKKLRPPFPNEIQTFAEREAKNEGESNLLLQRSSNGFTPPPIDSKSEQRNVTWKITTFFPSVYFWMGSILENCFNPPPKKQQKNVHLKQNFTANF